jgi:hypothetical protein
MGESMGRLSFSLPGQACWGIFFNFMHFLFGADLLHAGRTGNFSKKYLGRVQSPQISSAAGLHTFWAAKWALFFCYGPNLRFTVSEF